MQKQSIVKLSLLPVGLALAATGYAQSSSVGLTDNAPTFPYSGTARLEQSRSLGIAAGDMAPPPGKSLVDADAFYRFSQFDQASPNRYDMSGGNLRYAKSIEATKTAIAATVPFYFVDTDVPGMQDSALFGLDLNVEQPLGDIFAVGLHGAYLRTEADDTGVNSGFAGFGSDTWLAGAYAAARYAINDRVKLGAGVSYDHAFYSEAINFSNEGTDNGLISPVVSLTVKPCGKFSVTPYGMYTYNFKNSLSDKDSFEVGARLGYMINETWNVMAGYQTTLGSSFIDHSHMVYLGGGVRF